MTYSEDVKELVKLRLMSTPSNIKVSIGNFGEFSRDQLIEEVEEETPVGKAAIEMELLFIRKMPTLAKRISEQR
jgi:hypothetical protein